MNILHPVTSTLIVALLVNRSLVAVPIDPIEYSDPAEWLDLAGSATTIDFTGIPIGTAITDQYSELGVTFSSSQFTPTAVGGSGYIDGAGIRGEVDVIIDFDEPIFAVAFLSNVSGFVPAIQFFSPTDELIAEAGPVAGFGGFVLDDPIARVRILDGLDGPVRADNILFGPPIPTPGALPLLGVALLGAARNRRR